MNKKRNRIYKLRLNNEEYQLFKDKASRYSSISDMVRAAVVQFDDTKAKRKIELMKEIRPFYEKCSEHLGKLGGNFNQYMHRANELNAAGELHVDSFKAVVKQAILVQKEINKLKADYEELYQKFLKL